MLIVNADDWGLNRAITDATLDCFRQGRVSAVSAMVFMEDSNRAASLAKRHGMEVGLHINFTAPFSESVCSDPNLSRHQSLLIRSLRRNRYALVCYYPMLRAAFRYVYQSQHDEFCRLYGKPPSHLDGHQHMHLATNMLVDGVLPPGAIVRRSFSFAPGQKGWFNRTYRRCVDLCLARRFRLADYFYALSKHLPLTSNSRPIVAAQGANVELMTHAIKADEYACLMSDNWKDVTRDIHMGTHAQIRCQPVPIGLPFRGKGSHVC
jgi:hypothetical protein